MRHDSVSDGAGSKPAPLFLAPKTGDKPTDDLIVHLLDRVTAHDAEIATAKAIAAQAVTAAADAKTSADIAEATVKRLDAERPVMPWNAPVIVPPMPRGYTATTPFFGPIPTRAGATLVNTMPGFFPPRIG